MKNTYRINGRHLKEIYYFLYETSPVSTARVSRDIGISQRTLKKDLDIVSELLKSAGIKLIRKPRVGVYIDNLSKSQKSNINKIKEILKSCDTTAIKYNKNERRDRTLFRFLTSNKIPTIEKLSFDLMVSRTTIIKDIKIVRTWLDKENIHVRGKHGIGYIIDGDEKNIRNTLVNFLSKKVHTLRAKETDITLTSLESFLVRTLSNIDYLTAFAKNLNLQPLYQCINNLEVQSNSKLLEEDFLKLVISIIVSATRFKNGHSIKINPNELDEAKHHPEYECLQESLPSIGTFKTSIIPSEEIAYITLLYVSSEFIQHGNLNGKGERKKNLAKKIFKIAEDFIGIPFSTERDILNMCEVHIASTTEKLRHNIKIENPFIEEMKTNYPIPFALVSYLNSSVIQKSFGFLFPEAEVAFLTSYIAAAIEKMRNIHRKKTIAFVGGSTIPGVFNLILYKLKNELPDVDVIPAATWAELSDIESQKKIDLVVFSAPLPRYSEKIPFMEVKELLSNREVKRIKEILQMQKKNELSSFLSDMPIRIVFDKMNFRSQDKAISFLLKTLEEKEFINKEYKNVIIKQGKIGFLTYHPIPSLPAVLLRPVRFTPALRNGILIVTLNHTVSFKSLSEQGHAIKVKAIIMPLFKRKVWNNIIYYDDLAKFFNRSRKGVIK